VVSYFLGKEKIKELIIYLTITPSTNKIGTSSTSVSLMELALKMNFLSYNFHP
jgi:hypothetical protein